MEYNYQAYGYLNADRNQIFNGPGAGGRLLSLHAAAAKPYAGPRSITAATFRIALELYNGAQDEIEQLRQYYGQPNVNNVEVIELYKRLCIHFRIETGLTQEAFEVIRGNVQARISCPQANLQIVVDMINDMRRAAGFGNNQIQGNQNQGQLGGVAGPPTHIDDIVEQSNEVLALYEQQFPNPEYNNFQARAIDAEIQIRTPLMQRGNRAIGAGALSLWTTAYLALNRMQNNNADRIVAALQVMAAKGLEGAQAVIAQIGNMNAGEGQGVGQNRFAQMSNMDHLFNVYLWFFELCRIGDLNPSFALYNEYLRMVANVYFFVAGKQKIMRLLRMQEVGGRFGRLWLEFSNEQQSLYQAPWNPNLTRLRFVTLFVPTRENRQLNPPTLSMCADVGLLNLNRENPEFWNRLISIYVTERQEQQQLERSASLHVLHRMIVGARSPLHNTQRVAGNALNVQVVPFGGGNQIPPAINNNNQGANWINRNAINYQQGINQRQPGAVVNQMDHGNVQQINRNQNVNNVNNGGGGANPGPANMYAFNPNVLMQDENVRL